MPDLPVERRFHVHVRANKVKRCPKIHVLYKVASIAYSRNLEQTVFSIFVASANPLFTCVYELSTVDRISGIVTYDDALQLLKLVRSHLSHSLAFVFLSLIFLGRLRLWQR